MRNGIRHVLTRTTWRLRAIWVADEHPGTGSTDAFVLLGLNVAFQ